MKLSTLAFAGSLAFLSSMALSGSALAGDSLADDVIGNLYTMKTVYRAEYAPAAWKKKFTGYDLDTEFNKAIAAVQANPNLTLKDARTILKNFVYAMRDYHTSISFVSTEAASLGFTLKSAGGKFFIVYIDRNKLSEASFPFHVGDELVSVDGKTAAQAVAEVQVQIPENVPGTDQALAELRFTNRSAARGYEVPQGPVTLGIKAKGSDQVSQIQLIWDYVPERISPRGALGSSTGADLFKDGVDVTGQSSLFRPWMNAAVADAAPADNPYTLGTRKSFLPDLGTKVWESGDDNFFNAYIYKTDDRKLVGYVRIASYVAPDFTKALADFAKIVGLFQATTDAMIIDEVNNPGGSVFYLYSLASMLTDQPLKTPLHRMSITQGDIADALNAISRLQGVKNDEEAKKAIKPDELDGYPASYEFARFTVSYAQFLVSEWRAGRKLTQPYWIGGVDHINPAATRYSKPILVLTNHLDFSGGDFFPTILQDNKRVTILGSRTAGAGGYVNDVKIQNNVGIDAFRCTESIAERVDGNPIENLGVKPDLEYEMTEADLTQNYSPYIKAIQSAAASLVK
jgi:C-terminal processing protease CtpA/Prc